MASIFFKSPDHRERFFANMHSLGKVYEGKLDQEFGAALYLLTSNGALWREVRDYVTVEAIDFPAMLEDVDFLHGYEVLVRLAANLFNGNMHCDAIELMRLDDRNFMIAVTALQLRRVSLHVDDFKA